MGGKCNEKMKMENIKTYIMKILEKSKKGEDPSINELTNIRSNINQMDHHDFVRTDQILTIKANKTEDAYQWGSVIMNCKWKQI